MLLNLRGVAAAAGTGPLRNRLVATAAAAAGPRGPIGSRQPTNSRPHTAGGLRRTAGRCTFRSNVPRLTRPRRCACFASAQQAPPSGAEPHVPVLMEEVLSSFRGVRIKTYVDGTLGAAGHASAIAAEHQELRTLIGIDQDPLALELAHAKLSASGMGDDVDLHLVRTNFRNIRETIQSAGRPARDVGVDAILLDLGMSSMQVDTADRGFSFLNDGPLDMRMDPDGAITAEEIVNTWSERQLGAIFRDYGEEKLWRQYANKICVAREQQAIVTTIQLAELLGRPFYRGKKGKKGKTIHPATRVFQGLRIAVNDELGVVEKVIPDAISCLAAGGRLGIISFHSLEDRIVKRSFLAAAGRAPSDLTGTEARMQLEFEKPDPTVKLITRKPLSASGSEIEDNPRSRSAKYRVVEKL